jgi:hypothetical protein
MWSADLQLYNAGLNYNIINLQSFEIWILFSSSGKKGKEDRTHVLDPMVELASDQTKAEVIFRNVVILFIVT